MTLPKFTLGIEEEYQVIDPESRALTPYREEFFQRGQELLGEQIKPELMRSQVEVGTNVCHSIGEARDQLVHLRGTVKQLAAEYGLSMAAASTHPFSNWAQQEITAQERYIKHKETLGDIAQRMVIFGMHVHVGIDDRDLQLDVMDQARYFLPHFLALSTSSPFWNGRSTGLKSYRSIVFENLPRTGPPPSFGSWSEHQRFIETLIKTECIDEPTKIWWDIRPHPKFPTLEFRVTDVCTKIDEALCITALIVSVVAKLIKLRQDNKAWRRYEHHLISENRWRAVRYGIDGRLIDFGKQEQVPVRALIEELLEVVDDVVDDVGVRAEAEYANVILAEGTSADRQIATFEKTGSLEAVVDQLIEESSAGWG